MGLSERAIKTPYKSPKWKAIRRMVVFNDDGSRKPCAIQGSGCKGEASQADHIVPWRDGGSWFALENLRPSCAHCNNSAGANHKNANGWRRRTDLHLTVYVGPLAELDQHAIIDRDSTVLSLERLTEAFGDNKAGREMAAAAWHRVLHEVRRGDIQSGYVVIVATDMEEATMLPGDHKVGPLVEKGRNVTRDTSEHGFAPVESGRW